MILLRSFRSCCISFLLMTIVSISPGQKVLVYENIHTMKNYKYIPGNNIKLRLIDDEKRISDEIYDITDSSVILKVRREIFFDEITAVYRERYWVDLLSGFSMIAGVFYFSVDSFNRLINSEWPVVDEQTLAISAGLVIFGGILIPFRFKKIKAGGDWRFKTLDQGSY